MIFVGDKNIFRAPAVAVIPRKESLTRLGAQNRGLDRELSGSCFSRHVIQVPWPSLRSEDTLLPAKSQIRSQPPTLPLHSQDLEVRFLPYFFRYIGPVLLRSLSSCFPRPSMHSVPLRFRPPPAQCSPSAHQTKTRVLWMLLLEHDTFLNEGSDWGIRRCQEEG
jgi:hypothetical protein